MNIKYLNGKVLKTYKAKLIKHDRPSKYMYNILSVQADKKYGYFIVSTKIYHHEIVTLHRFTEVDKIELYDEENKLPIQVIEQE